jgi:hypothetical protein
MSDTQREAISKLYIPSDGVYFDPSDPDPEKMNLDTIAHGLATEFRYGGHTEPLVNVAQHAVDTSTLLEELGYNERVQFYGLHHDSSEAYIGDLQKPNKEALTCFDGFEDAWQDAVWDFLDVENPTQAQYDAVKEVDYQLYGFEADNLFENRNHAEQAIEAAGVPEWDTRNGVPDLDELVDFERGVEESRGAFLDRHGELVTRI